MQESFKIPDIPESEKTPIVLLLLEIIENQRQEIQSLKDEIARLKGNPPKPKLKPSTTIEIDKAERAKSAGGASKKKTSRRKREGW